MVRNNLCPKCDSSINKWHCLQCEYIKPHLFSIRLSHATCSFCYLHEDDSIHETDVCQGMLGWQEPQFRCERLVPKSTKLCLDCCYLGWGVWRDPETGHIEGDKLSLIPSDTGHLKLPEPTITDRASIISFHSEGEEVMRLETIPNIGLCCKEGVEVSYRGNHIWTAPKDSFFPDDALTSVEVWGFIGRGKRNTRGKFLHWLSVLLGAKKYP